MNLKSQMLAWSQQWVGLQSLVPDCVRGGGVGYLGMRRTIDRSGIQPPHEMERMVFQRLRMLLEDAVVHIPFYKAFYREHGFSPAEVNSLADWHKVPIVTKKDFQRFDLEARCRAGVGGTVCNTGGTSGAPLAFRLPRQASAVEWAHMHTLWRARGYRGSHVKLRFGGAYRKDCAALWYHPKHNEFIVNANSSMAEVLEAVLGLWPTHTVRWLHGYPSLIAEFAHALEAVPERRAAVFRQQLYGVLLSSEYPAPVYREPINRILTTCVVSWYGHSEMAVLAGETAQGIYQSLPTYGYAEAVAQDGERASRLVCSSLHNRVHPFIRYDTGDLIEPMTQVGTSLAFKIAEGRVGDFIEDRARRRLALTSIIFGRHHPAFDDLLHLQIRQEAAGRISLLVVPRDACAAADTFRSGFDFSGLDLDWDVLLIPAPVRTPAGKIKLKVEA